MPGLLCSAAVAVSGADWALKEQMGPVGVSDESSLLFKNADGMEKLSQPSLLVLHKVYSQVLTATTVHRVYLRVQALSLNKLPAKTTFRFRTSTLYET